MEGKLVGLVTVCQELQQLLKCAFIGKMRESVNNVHKVIEFI